MDEIIVALATAWGESGVSVVRVSGEGSVGLAGKLFSGKNELAEYPPRYMALGKLRDRGGVFFDEVLAVRFEKGASYTGEESVELHCHGGVLPAQRCIEELCSLGATIARPGEFTKRAFINGRLDLSQAEAVLGLIRSKSDEALRASARTLQGGFTTEIKTLLDELTILAARLEVDLDFPEEGQGLMSAGESAGCFSGLIEKTEDILFRSRSGMLLREGIKVAIIGRPNVGKSSLLNALLKEARAIVTPVPGTTRDRIEEVFVHKGVPVRIIDTAGIRQTADEIESLGVARSIESMLEADLRVWVIDAAEPLIQDELNLAKEILCKNHIIALNKDDLPKVTTEEDLRAKYPNSKIISISAMKAEGTDELKDLIISEMGGCANFADSYGVTARQIECLKNALAAEREALNLTISRLSDDLILTFVSDARAHLSALLGLDPTEDLLDTVFGSFCVGK